MDFAMGLVVGAVLGAALVLVAVIVRGRAEKAQLRDAFASLAGEALDANSRRLGELTATALEGKKELIDKSVAAVGENLEKIRGFLQQMELERKTDFTRLSTSVTSLSSTAGDLHKMLASTQRRGAWGERMAEDVLRLVGMQEGVNYSKQSSASADTGIPDFTFFLPNDLKANMDVKFPLESYKVYVDATDDPGRSAALKQLVTAVRGHVRAVASRGYIDPKAPTVDYVIVFLPSEQVYSLALSGEVDLMDEALQKRVVLAGPMTLYAMLAVMRQAAESANLMKTADEVLSLLGEFHKQWGKYNEELKKLGDCIERASRQFDTVRSRRTNMLERPLDKIEQLRTTRSLPHEPDASDA